MSLQEEITNKIINPNYSIIIKREGTNKDIIIINCYNNYIMKLIHYIHAKFESAKRYGISPSRLGATSTSIFT